MKTPRSAKPKTIKDAKKATKRAKTRRVVRVIERPNGDPAVEDAEWLEAERLRAIKKRVTECLPEPGFKTPPLSLLAKLGSIAVHAEELLSPDGHSFDRTALEQILRNPEVTAWIKDMGLPRKRSS